MMLMLRRFVESCQEQYTQMRADAPSICVSSSGALIFLEICTQGLDTVEP